jgi:hypothetical protein
MVAITSINDESRVWGDSYVTPTADVMRMERHFRDASEPFSWTIIGDPVRHGRVLWVYGYPATAQTLDFIYFRRPRPLVFDGVALYSSQAGGTVSGVTAGGAAATLSTAVGDDVPGAVIRFGRTGTAVPQGRHTANPYWFQRVITSVTSGTALTLDSVADYTVTATGYAISDPLDIPEYLIEPLLRGCEYFYLLSTDQSRARFAHDAYLRAVQLAAGCDVAAPLPAGTWTDFSDAPRDYVVNSVTVHTW